MKFAYVIAALLLATSAVEALEVRNIKIIEYGTYTADEKSCARDAQGIQRCERGDVHHSITTWNVPAQIGVEFGLRYQVVGAPKGAKVSVKRVWRLPEPGFKSPATDKPILRLDRIDETSVGDTVYVSYAFDDPWELVPGAWTLEFWYGDRKLGEQKFVITKP